MSKNFDSPIEVGFCGAKPYVSFDPEQVERFEPEEYSDNGLAGAVLVRASDYDQLLALYRDAVSVQAHISGEKPKFR